MKTRYVDNFHPFLVTDLDIEIAVQSVIDDYGMNHESTDSVRICVEWFLAQDKTTNISDAALSLKHLIEHWGGRYVSRGDVQAAALLVGIDGSYPCYGLNLTSLVLPDTRRLAGIKEANSHRRVADLDEEFESAYEFKEVIK